MRWSSNCSRSWIVAAEPTDGVRADLFDAAFLGRVEQLALLARRIASSGQRAQRRSKQVGSGLEFADHRAYVAGDDPKAIDWALYARTERLQLRQFEEEEDLSVWFLVDRSASMAMAPPGTVHLLDRALQITAALAYIALGNLDRVAVVPFGEEVQAPGRTLRGRPQFFRILRTLSAIRPVGRTALEASVCTFTRHDPRRGLVVLVSDFYDPAGLGRALTDLAVRGHEPLVLHLCDQSLLDTGAQGDLSLVDVETGEARDVVMTPALMARYREAFAEFQASIAHAARQAGARCLHVDVAQPFDDVVMRVFRSGGFLR
jgi:uncharacterized protein (DUF58 family)